MWFETYDFRGCIGNCNKCDGCTNRIYDKNGDHLLIWFWLPEEWLNNHEFQTDDGDVCTPYEYNCNWSTFDGNLDLLMQAEQDGIQIQYKEWLR